MFGKFVGRVSLLFLAASGLAAAVDPNATSPDLNATGNVPVRPTTTDVVRLANEMRSPDDGVRQLAAARLRNYGASGPIGNPTTQVAVTALTAGLSDPSIGVQRASLVSLRAYGEAALPALNVLIQSLQHSGDIDRGWFAADAIGSIGPDAASAVPVLVKSLEIDQSTHGPPSLRASAARALGRIGPDSAEALARLRQILSNSDPELQIVVAVAVGRIHPADEQASAALERIAKEGPWYLRADAIGGIEEIAGGNPQRALAALKTYINDPQEDVRDEASAAIAIINKALSSGATTIPAIDPQD